MNNFKKYFMVVIIIILSVTIFAQAEEKIISLYEGSEIIYDDMIGYEELPVLVNDSTVSVVEGVILRQWCEAPEGRSPLEIIKNYENAIKSTGGEILFTTRDPESLEINERAFADYFSENRRGRGLSTGNEFSFTKFPEEINEYLAGKIITSDKEVYIIVAAGKGHWAADQDNTTFFELITLKAEPMEMGMVNIDALKKGLATYGRVAVYSIYFATGEAKVKEESAEALAIIAEFLKQNTANRYFVVGHTDNTGSYEMNINLSEARAKAVVEKLINEYEVDEEQLMPSGVGPKSPILSNSTEEGRAQNRRVEIVEM